MTTLALYIYSSYSPLFVDTNAMLTRPITLQRFKMITRWHSLIIKLISDFKLTEFTSCNFGNVTEMPYWITL